MIGRKKYEISKGTRGKRMVLLDETPKDIDLLAKRRNVVELELNDGKGWKSNNDVSFLERMPFLKSIEIIDYGIDDVSHIHALKALESMKVLTYCNTEIDFSRFPCIEEASFEWRPKAASASVYECVRLKKLFINHCTATSLDQFANLVNLQWLLLKSPRLERIGDVSRMSKLEHLGICVAKKLSSLAGIEVLRSLKELEIATCRKIVDLDPVGKLRGIEWLLIDNCGDVASIKPLLSLSRLELFSFCETTNVLDGDIAILKELPSLKSISFQNRRHYNIKRSEFPGY